MNKDRGTIVIALGGNALNSPEDRGGYFEQIKNAEKAAKEIAKIVKAGYRTVITHGNGPQVGNILLQQEYSKEEISPMPLPVCGAESQGQIGTILVKTLNEEFKKLKLKTSAVGLITHVLVDKKDKAFKNPQKPIGPIYTPKEIEKLQKEGQIFQEIKIGAFRRVVSSPRPLKILEIEAIKNLLNQNLVIVAVGGGGIPLTEDRGKLKLVDAVIDKDSASQVLASQLGAEKFIILTNVEKVALNFQKENQKWLDSLTLRQAKQYLTKGHFPPGSMGPKMGSVIKFIEKGGKRAIICHLKDLKLALQEKAGTILT